MGFREWRRDLGYASGVLRGKPFHLLLQLTNRCNMRCTFCDFWPNGVAPSEELSLDDFRRLETELSSLGRFFISIEGGEPFVRPDLVEIVRTLSRRHITVLYTNGWYVTAERAKALFDAGLTQAGVSIDYADAARHDAKRDLAGATERAWAAVDTFRSEAPHGGRQVHVMTVLMDSNVGDVERLLQQSAEKDVGHHVTLISTGGFRRGGSGVDALPRESVTPLLMDLWHRYPHFRIMRDYLERIDGFLEGGAGLPTCYAGEQSFNIDHVGNVSPCIEKIDHPVGNVRREPLAAIHARMNGLDEVRACQQCWTACRGYATTLARGGSLRGWVDLSTRMRSV